MVFIRGRPANLAPNRSAAVRQARIRVSGMVGSSYANGLLPGVHQPVVIRIVADGIDRAKS